MENSFARARRQETAPLFEGLINYAERTRSIRFHMPGHRGGRGVDPLFRRYGGDLLSLDLTELRAINYGKDPDFLLESAESLAAEAFGAKSTFFLVNGASIGIAASLIGLKTVGEEVLVSRDCHLSVVNGLVLSGMKPRFIPPRWVEGLPALSTVTDFERIINERPGAAGIFITNPGYSGIYGPLEPVAALAKRYSIPLLIDEAHGGHLGFLGLKEASAVGADLWVWGFHKMLGSLTQTGMLHVGSNRINPQRIKEALELLSTTSPSYILLASLDSARRKLYFHGEKMFLKAAGFGEKVRKQLREVKGLRVFDHHDLPSGYGLDPTKIVVSFRPSGLSGLRAEEILSRKFRIQPEYADRDNIYFFISYAQEEEEIDELIKACRNLALSGEKEDLILDLTPIRQVGPDFTPPPWKSEDLLLSPREAFQAPAAHIRLDEAVGKLASGVVAAYPPGIPLWIPGERVTPEMVEWIIDLQRTGGYLKGITEGTVKVVAES